MARGPKPQSKAASTRSKNTARAAELKAAGTTAIGGRIKAKGFSGGKGAQQNAGGLRGAATTGLRRRATAAGAGTRSMLKANAAKVGKDRSRRASKGGKPPARTNKSPVSAAKQRYQELSSRARRSGPYRDASDNRKAAGARRSMAAMVAKRGR